MDEPNTSDQPTPPGTPSEPAQPTQPMQAVQPPVSPPPTTLQQPPSGTPPRGPSKWPIVAIVLAALILIAALVGIGLMYAKVNDRLADAQDRVSELEEQLGPSEEDTSSSGPTESGEPTQPTAPEEPSPSTPAPTPSGPTKAFTYITDVSESGGVFTITCDYALFLTGDEAADAATAHGDESPPPNDYYIVNDNPMLRTFTAKGTCVVRLTTQTDGTTVGPAGYPITFGEWFDLYIGMLMGGEFTHNVPYWITLDGTEIIKIEEQYVP